ncbi:probable cation-transporting ATPase 13A4 [Pelobates cultripes]|nr:probable cation-transporting ATPase 13A4 [Pelobates cultripes]
MLTGESIPVTKSPLENIQNSTPWKIQSGEDFKRHVLFCGTEVIQTSSFGYDNVIAVVKQTGFNTAKGDMVRSILFPKPMNFKLYQDATRFLMCLVAIAVVGFIYTVVLFSVKGETARDIIVKALIAITVAIPPVLPAAVAVAIMYAQKRLKKKKIFCISPQRINVCGRINVVCFDKTGTLTEDGLDLWGVLPAVENSFQNVHMFTNGNSLQWSPLLGAMACCHSLIVLDGKIQGDPLDLKMFEGTNWVLDNSCQENECDDISKQGLVIKPGPDNSSVPPEGIIILLQFPFSSSLQRMSVVAQVLGSEEKFVFMKGAPEMVTRFCLPDSVPHNFSSQLQEYTLQGFRVIGLAYKTLHEQQCNEDKDSYPREEVECDLIFLGLLIMENRLKAETIPALSELNNALIRTVMITGDNLQTAITVARNSGVVQGCTMVILIEASEPNEKYPASISWSKMDSHRSEMREMRDFDSERCEESTMYHFAMTGNTYQVIVKHFYNLLPKILLNGTIFARMSPGQKSNLVEEFQNMDYYVAMCGDGANDCGALKMAHAGISLSEQEASVASPFTSHIANIQCVPLLIKEGRAALVASFSVFKYVTLYAMIQFMCLLLLYWELKFVGLYQYLIQDVGITIVATLTMSLTHAYPKLAPYRPPAQLISPPLLLSVIFNVLLNLAMQICSFVVLQKQPWYSKTDFSVCMVLILGRANETLTSLSNGSSTEVQESSVYENYETTTLWPITTISCIIVAFVFSKGKPFRKPIYTNYIFFFLLPIQLAACLFVLFSDFERLYRALQLVCTPTLWRVAILIILVIGFIVSYTVEEAVIENRRLWLYLKKLFNYHSRSQYRVLYRALKDDPNWPPVNKTHIHLSGLADRSLPEILFFNAIRRECQGQFQPIEDLFGYRTVHWRQVLCVVGYIFSLGILPLLFYWKPEWDVWSQCVPCNLESANVVLLQTTDDFKQYCKKKETSVSNEIAQSQNPHPCARVRGGPHPLLRGPHPPLRASTHCSGGPTHCAEGPHPPLKAGHISKCGLLRKGVQQHIRYISVQRVRYIWNALEKCFQKPGVLEEQYSCLDVHSKFGSGLSYEEQEIRQVVCGLNTIEVEITPIWKLLFKEVLNPFYIAQAYALIIWFATGYIEFSVVLLIITLLSAGATVYYLRMGYFKLHNLFESHNNTVTILRKNGAIEEIESRYLVPGDVIIITARKFYLPCDAILITGGCRVNEGMLTGESVPVTKTPLPHTNNTVPWKAYSAEDYKSHILFCGTEIIQSQPSGNCLIKAVVLKTGFNSAKGDLVGSILYPKPVNFKLQRDVKRFIIGLLGISVIGVIYTIIIYINSGISLQIRDQIRSDQMRSVNIPAALPAAVAMNMLYSQMRLQKIGIFCTSIQRIGICGQLNIICFDKTGTLTEDGMELWGVLPSSGECFQDVNFFTPEISLSWGPLLGAMVSCHSLILLDGVVHGDPIDLKMFEGTAWIHQSQLPIAAQENARLERPTCCILKWNAVIEPQVPVEGVALLHQFPFSSSLQRMSVIVQVIGEDELLVFMKGAPEMVVKFCKPETVPSNFQKELDYCTSQGFRVISLAYKILATDNHTDISNMERKDTLRFFLVLDFELAFIGLLIMENRLKPETKSVLEELNAANIRSVMVTACTVAKSSGMISMGSNLIVVEAHAPGKKSAASISWKTMQDNKENCHLDYVYKQVSNCGHDNKSLDFHFAMDGKTYQVIEDHFYDLLPKLLINGTVFARMCPRQKAKLIEEFQKIDYCAGMCGDGANDCGALKVAHAGISLSELEASVASPFTSKTPNIECIPKLIKEGRNCLVTSFCIFKYNAMYSMICMICMMLLFWNKLNILGNRHYLIQDVGITITFSLTMSLTGPSPTLAPYRPPARLISPPILLSIILNLIFSLIIQTVGFTVVQQQSWYNETDIFSGCLPLNMSLYNYTIKEIPEKDQNYLTTTMWFISGMNLIVVEFVFSKGKPFRKPIYTNYFYFFIIAAQLAAYIFLYFADIESVYHIMEFVCTPYYWRGNVLIMIAVLFALSYFAEEPVMEKRLALWPRPRKLWKMCKTIFNYTSKSKYKMLQRMVKNYPQWPPQNKLVYSTQKSAGKDGWWYRRITTRWETKRWDLSGERTHQEFQASGREQEIHGYRTDLLRSKLCIVGYFVSLGFLRLLFYWKPMIDILCHCVPCSLEEADVILLRSTDECKKYFKKKVIWIHSNLLDTRADHNTIALDKSVENKLIMKTMCKVRCITVQRIRYIWNAVNGVFQKIGVLEDRYSCSDIHQHFGTGLSKEEQIDRRQLCGLNTIDVEITPIWKLLFKEILNPIYLFEMYTLCTWLATGYIEYSMAIIIMTILSILATIYLLRMQSVKLHRMVESHNNVMVTVLQKNGVIDKMESRHLVPGDVLILTGNKFYLPCDAILISGGCIVNEGMLTGESIPVTKTALPNVDNGIPWKEHIGENCKGHMLFCGTEVIKTKPFDDGMVKAIVLQTGFNTAKGDLVRSILYPKPVNYELQRDILKTVIVLVGLSSVGVLYTAVISSLNGAKAHEIVLMILIMATSAVPVSLPSALTVCTLYSQTRLNSQGIFCISPQRINLCGQINLFCFDKTGTLTEDGLDLWGVVPSESHGFQEVRDMNAGFTLSWSPLLGAMASCHSLVLLDKNLHGDPLDLKMFEATGWDLQEYKNDWKGDGSTGSDILVKPKSRMQSVPVEGITILHQFPFSSSLQRMSVITQVSGEKKLTVFLKGAPEVMIQLCKKDTVPSDFSSTLDHYTSQGFRVIGMAFKHLEPNEVLDFKQLQRELAESDIVFLGFLIMENRLKPETKPVLEELKSAKIRTVMITGDNLHTACTVGINSGMVSDSSNLFIIEATEPKENSPATIIHKLVETNAKEGNKENMKIMHVAFSGNENVWSQGTGVGNYSYAMSGKAYEIINQHFPNLIPDVLINGTIFARMTPKQKSKIIEDFQKLNYCVGMCGDGANDCGALKMAHAGISLSKLEASVASPFTSKISNIECVPKLLKEGRNAFVTSISLFKYLIMYTMIELVCMLLLFWKQTLLGNYHYLMQDMAITVIVMLTMSLNGPAPKLAPYRPTGKLLSSSLLLSLLLHTTFTIIVQTSTFIQVQQQSWYNKSDVYGACLPQTESSFNQTMEIKHLDSKNVFTTTLWFVSGFHLIVMECIFSKGQPFRQPIYTNYLFFILIILQLGSYLFMLFADIETLYSAMELVCTPYSWRYTIFCAVLVLFGLSYGIEEFVIENRNLWLVVKKIFKCKPKSEYKKLQSSLDKDRTHCVYHC